MAARARPFSRAIIDVGTGDGAYPLHVARSRADIFAIGLDPSFDALKQTARAVARRRLPNVALIIADVLGAGLDLVADEVTVHFPWGPLLEAVSGRDARVLDAVAQLAKPGAHVRILASAIERDGGAVVDLSSFEFLRGPYRDAGLEIREVRRATRSDIESAHSTWGKRLGAGVTRPAYVLRCVRRREVAASVLVTASGGDGERPEASHR